MIQYDVIKRANRAFERVPGLKAALLIGSTARKTASVRSDIDYSLLVDDKVFAAENLKDALSEELEVFGLVRSTVVSVQRRIVLYFSSCPKLEMVYYTNQSDMDRNYLGSEIPMECIDSSIAYSSDATVKEVLKKHLVTITEAKKEHLQHDGKTDLIYQHIERFLYEFEVASRQHARSDAYQFYFFYNIALDSLISLAALAKLPANDCRFAFLPKYGKDLFKDYDQSDVLNLASLLDLTQANDKKRNLLDMFYQVLDRLNIQDKDKRDARIFLEYVYDRDYYWNLRDIAQNNSYFKPGHLFRSATLSMYTDIDAVKRLRDRYGISKVIDLRDDREYAAFPYADDALKMFQHIRLPFDCYNQSQDFCAKYHYGSGAQIAYRHFAVGHKHCFKELFETVDPEKEVCLIHCFAGKDRTGCVVALLALLVGTPIDIIYEDYLGSEIDTDIEKLNAFLEIIQAEGGVIAYLKSCGIAIESINHWKQALSKND